GWCCSCSRWSQFFSSRFTAVCGPSRPTFQHLDYLRCRHADNCSKLLKLQQFSISNFHSQTPVRLLRVERIGGSPRLRGGKSELRRAAGWITSRRGNATESATENRPPNWSRQAGPEARVKRCGKRAPRPARAATAWQTPCGARPNREAMEPPVSVTSFRVGCSITAETRVTDE